MDKIPLNYEASEGDTHKRQTSTLPIEVVQCLENARFVGLMMLVNGYTEIQQLTGCE